MQTQPAAPGSDTESAEPARSLESLPGPRNWPLLGSLLHVRPTQIHLLMEQWCQKYGPLFRVYFGRTLLLVVARHSTVNAVLKDRPDGFRRPSITARVGIEAGMLPNVFMAEGADWRNQRRMVMAGFAPKPIKAYFPALVIVSERLQRRWVRAAELDAAIDLSADLKRYTVDIIAGLAFGEDVNTLEAGDNVIQQHLDVILPAIARRALSPLPYWRWFKLPQDRRLDASSAALRQAVLTLVDTAKARMQANPHRADKPGNLLEAMLAAAGQPASHINTDTVAGNVSTMLLAGEDTTAHSIAWLLHLLYSHPAALAKATAEVLELTPDADDLSLEKFDDMAYLGACIEEAMRLKPVGPFLPLEALRDTTIEGVHVLAGTLVWCVMRHDSVSSAYFANPAAFEPERWLNAAADDDGPDETKSWASAQPIGKPNAGTALQASKGISMPFGAGVRTCPGRYLALLEIKIAVAMLLRHFEMVSLSTPDGMAPKELMGFVMSPMALSLRLRLRRKLVEH